MFPDDPTQTVWYMPDTGNEEAGSSVPTGTFQGNTINWSEVTTLTNADLAPTAFSDLAVTVDENGSVNIPVAPVDATFTTTVFDTDGSGLTLVSGNIQGTAPSVADNNVSNPSDEYLLSVTRTNTYGSSTGLVTLTVRNLTAPATAVSGFNWENTSTPLVDSDTLDDGSVVRMNNTLSDGTRLIFDQTWIETNVLPNLTDVGDKFFVGIQNGNDWTDGVQAADFGAHFSIERLANNQMQSTISNGTTTDVIAVSSITDAYYDYAFEYDGTDLHVIACNVNAINTEPAINEGGVFSRHITQTGQSGHLTIHIGVEGATADISATTTIDIPTPVAPSILTPWTKALDFSGSSEYLKQVANWTTVSPLRMGDTSTNIAPPTTAGNTAYGASVRPWATAVVFQSKNNTGNQHIWNQGEGAGSTDDNIYLRVDGLGHLYVGWGRQGEVNECKIGSIGGSANSTHWWGVYVANNGTRLSAANATAANLADAFDIRLMGSNDAPSAWSGLYDVGTEADWTAGSTGARMDRSYTGDFTIGGRGSNRNFHGKVASMVVTTLRINQPMPTDAEIRLMITDPKKWVDDYKIGNPYRKSHQPQDFSNFAYGNVDCHRATQMWLMGDGTYDSYANGIRNQISPDDQNNNKIQLNSMVSNDIQTISISGLT